LRAEPGLLGAALRGWAARAQKRLVVFVDQFEELADDASSPLRVVLSVRSDFIERLAGHERFMAAMRARGCARRW
ncbi:hypothetical protein BE20_14110, partial [Sorangium cellulosum]